MCVFRHLPAALRVYTSRAAMQEIQTAVPRYISGSGGDSNTGAIVGGVVAGMLVCMAAMCAVIALKRRRRQSYASKDRHVRHFAEQLPHDQIILIGILTC